MAYSADSYQVQQELCTWSIWQLPLLLKRLLPGIEFQLGFCIAATFAVFPTRMHLYWEDLKLSFLYLLRLDVFVGSIGPLLWPFRNTKGARFKHWDIAGVVLLDKVHWRSVSFSPILKINQLKNRIKTSSLALHMLNLDLQCLTFRTPWDHVSSFSRHTPLGGSISSLVHDLIWDSCQVFDMNWPGKPSFWHALEASLCWTRQALEMLWAKNNPGLCIHVCKQSFGWGRLEVDRQHVGTSQHGRTA